MEGAKMRGWTCSRCLWAQQRRAVLVQNSLSARRNVSCSTTLRAESGSSKQDDVPTKQEKEMGALSRRLSDMAEESMNTGSKSDRKLMQDVGFSEELKKQLEERIAQSAFKAQNQQAITEAEMPSYVGKGTSSTATSQAWSGAESVEDAALRMLDDAHKKIRTPTRAPRIPQTVVLKQKPKVKVSSADRLVNARDKTSIYAFSQQEHLSEEEREKYRKEMKERFTPGARQIPATLQGLASLANERIEDAIARGQFKNITRGKGVNTERDHVANSPFLDTTEYFMNKIIQKQEIVPPWIEKQQELVKMANSFRSRLRSDWRRHSARMIASTGGSIDEQIRRAKGYALAEEIVNPKIRKGESHTSIGSDGSLVSVTLEDKIAAGVIEEVTQELKKEGIDVQLKVEETSTATDPKTESSIATTITPQPAQTTHPPPPNTSTITPHNKAAPSVLPMPYPFRDESWLRTESAYHALAIAELNTHTRSYNLMAPKIAQKPYFTLDRELRKCYADVAPLVADEILARARAPKYVVGLGREREGILEKVVGEERVWKGHEGRIRDEDGGRGYGWRQFWRDLFRKENASKVRRETETG